MNKGLSHVFAWLYNVHNAIEVSTLNKTTEEYLKWKEKHHKFIKREYMNRVACKLVKLSREKIGL